MVLFWRLMSVTFLTISFFLVMQSLMRERIDLFYVSLVIYSLSSLVWLTIQKLYVEPFTPKTIKSASHWSSSFNDIANILDLMLSLPKYIFYMLIKFFKAFD